MKAVRFVLCLITLVVLAAVVGITACSKSSYKPTNPSGGGLELNSGNILAGGTFDHTFSTAGTFPYHCAIHAVMTGNSVIVDANSSVTSANVSIVGASAPGFSPSTVTIKVGGMVHWTNNGGTTHTVTSGS